MESSTWQSSTATFKQKSKVMSSKASNVYHMSVRWSVKHTDENLKKLQACLRDTADKWIFQAEYTENDGKGNPHYQGYMHLSKKSRAKSTAVAMNLVCRGIEVRPSSTAGLAALRRYVMKDDTRVAGPWADRRIYMAEDLWSEEKQLPWQKALTVMIRAPPDDRTMVWIFDPVGNNGKTKYIKWLAYKKLALSLTYGNSGDILNLVYKFQNYQAYVWNLTRAKPHQLSELDLYATMESVKDGLFVNTKYETDQILMCVPHVVVMANHLPKMQHISTDRWKIYSIHDGKLVPYNKA